MLQTRRRIPGRYRAFVYAVLVHLAVVALLVIGFRWSTTATVPEGQTVQAVAVEDPQKRKLEEEEKRRRAEEEKQRAEEARRQEQQRKEEEAEKKRQADLKRKQQEEVERKRQEEAKRKQEEERKQKAEAERKRQEAERRQAAEDTLRQQLAAEEQARNDAARAARAATEAERYQALIRRRVYESWSLPVGSQEGLRCVVRVRLLGGGEVADVVVVRGSGNSIFDRSAEAAVRKASPLPVPQDPDVFAQLREFNLELVKPKQ